MNCLPMELKTCVVLCNSLREKVNLVFTLYIFSYGLNFVFKTYKIKQLFQFVINWYQKPSVTLWSRSHWSATGKKQKQCQTMQTQTKKLKLIRFLVYFRCCNAVFTLLYLKEMIYFVHMATYFVIHTRIFGFI